MHAVGAGENAAASDPSQRLNAALVVVSMLGLYLVDSIASVVFRRSNILVSGYFEMLQGPATDTPIWIRGLTIACFLTCAVASLRALSRGSVASRQLRHLMMLVTGVVGVLAIRDAVWTQVGENSLLLYGKASPGVLLLMWGILATAGNEAARIYRKGLSVLAIGAAVTVGISLPAVSGATRWEVLRFLHDPLVALEVSALWVFSWRGSTRLISIAVWILYVWGALLTQTRALVVYPLILGLILTLALLQQRRLGRLAQLVRIAAVLVAIGASGILLSPNIPGLAGATSGLSERLFEDTRSYQWLAFRDALSLDIVLFGGGMPVDYEPSFAGGGERGIDSGYANMLWIGGIGLVLGYVGLLFWYPMARVRRPEPGKEGQAALLAASVAAYGVRMLSSTNPGFNAPFLGVMMSMVALMCVTREDVR